jgi:hypothetical protein
VSNGTGGEGTHSWFAGQPETDWKAGAHATACVPQDHWGTIEVGCGWQDAPLPTDPEIVISGLMPQVPVCDCTPTHVFWSGSVTPPPSQPVVHPAVANPTVTGLQLAPVGAPHVHPHAACDAESIKPPWKAKPG